MYITELHSLAPLPPKIRYFFPVNYGWEALKVVFRVASKACQKMHRLFWPIRCLVEHTTNGAIMPKKSFRHNGTFFCLLLYMSARSGFWNIPLMHINLFFQDNFYDISHVFSVVILQVWPISREEIGALEENFGVSCCYPWASDVWIFAT